MSGYTGGIGGLPSRPPARCFNFVVPMPPPDPDPDPDPDTEDCPELIPEEYVGMYWSGIDELTIDFTNDVTLEQMQALQDTVNRVVFMFKITDSGSVSQQVGLVTAPDFVVNVADRKVVVTNVQASNQNNNNPADVIAAHLICGFNTTVASTTTFNPDGDPNFPYIDSYSLWLPDEFWETTNPPFDISGSRNEWRLQGSCDPSLARYYCASDGIMVTSHTTVLQDAAYVNITSDLGQFDNIPVTAYLVGSSPWERSLIWIEDVSQYGFDFYVINVYDANDNLLCNWNPPSDVWHNFPINLDTNRCVPHGVYPSQAGYVPPNNNGQVILASVDSSWGDNNDVSIFATSCNLLNNDQDSDPRLWMQLDGQGFDAPGITAIRVLDENNSYIDYPYTYGSGQLNIKDESSTQLFLSLGRYDEIPWHPGNIVHVSFIQGGSPVGYTQALIQMESIQKMGMTITGGFRINFTAPWQHDIRKVNLAMCLGFTPGNSIDTEIEVRNPLTPADVSWNTGAGFTDVVFNPAGAISFESSIHSMNLVARADVMDASNLILSSVTRRRFEAM